MNDNMIEENWEVITGYDGKYSVSDHGNVYDNWSERMLVSNPRDNAYPSVGLRKGNKDKTHYIHRLVGTAFIPKLNEDMVINHIDEIKSNNHVDNLEWCTIEENLNHGTRNERIRNSEGQKRNGKHARKLLGIKIKGVSIDDGHVIYFDSIHQGKEHGFDPRSVGRNLSGETKKYKGYVWSKI